MKAIGQMQAFLGNGDQQISADRDPDLRLDRVLVGTIKRLDAQVLLDPFEKQFDLPALAVQVCTCNLGPCDRHGEWLRIGEKCSGAETP